MSRLSWPVCVLGLTLLLGVMATSTPDVAIRLSTQTLYVNHALTLTCNVRPDDRNRWISAGLRFHQSSVRPLQGSADITPHTFTFQHVGCPDDEVWVAFCQLRRSDDSVIDAVEKVQVAGCQ